MRSKDLDMRGYFHDKKFFRGINIIIMLKDMLLVLKNSSIIMRNYQFYFIFFLF